RGFQGPDARAPPPGGVRRARPADAADPRAGAAHLHAGRVGRAGRRARITALPRRQQARPVTGGSLAAGLLSVERSLLRSTAQRRKSGLRPRRQILQSAFAASTIASAVKPKCSNSTPPGALAPKRSMPTTAPSRPTYWRQKPVMPASTATRLRTALGSTDSR